MRILTSTTSLISVVRISPSTVSLGRDLVHGRQFNSMTTNVNLFHNVLAFFTASDGIVNENLTEHFFNDDVQAAEARYLYGFQIMMENLS
ncbi:hypothetical protein BDR07DRAFT_1422487 [Suillus spraguei]|nr:hypothetical protein BDR07DRAFT_1422487 [Suillus spraguei]